MSGRSKWETWESEQLKFVNALIPHLNMSYFQFYSHVWSEFESSWQLPNTSLETLKIRRGRHVRQVALTYLGISVFRFEKRCTRPRNLGSQSVAGGPTVISKLHSNGPWRKYNSRIKTFALISTSFLSIIVIFVLNCNNIKYFTYCTVASAAQYILNKRQKNQKVVRQSRQIYSAVRTRQTADLSALKHYI
jgi:hypothetical protein